MLKHSYYLLKQTTLPCRPISIANNSLYFNNYSLTKTQQTDMRICHCVLSMTVCNGCWLDG